MQIGYSHSISWFYQIRSGSVFLSPVYDRYFSLLLYFDARITPKTAKTEVAQSLL